MTEDASPEDVMRLHVHATYPHVTRYTVLRATREVVLAVMYELRGQDLWVRVLYPNGAAGWVDSKCLAPHLPFVFPIFSDGGRKT